MNDTKHDEPQDSEADGLDALDRGAEPFWMQDVRCAQRIIAARMEAIRRANARSPRSNSDD